MTPYLIIFFIVAILAFINNDGQKKSFLPFFAVCMAIGLFVGLGDMLGGYDRYIYGEVFTSMATSNDIQWKDALILNLGFFRTEVGYGLWNLLIGVFTPNRYIFILATTLLIYLLLAVNLHRTMRNPYFGLMIFMGLWFFFSFTYLRQVLAANIVWLSLPYVWKRKFWSFSFIVFVAALFHNSAILFEIVYFIPLRKFEKQWIVIGMGVLLLAGLTNITGQIFSAYGEIVDPAVERAQIYVESSQDGFRFAYLLEGLFFLIILLSNYDKIDFRNPKLATLVNVYLLFCATLMFFVRSSDGGRLAWYFMIGVFSISAYLAAMRYNEKLKLMYGVLSFFLFYRILSAWAFNMCPYKTFLTPGHTAAEWIYYKYEYDYNYDQDKLYNL